MSWDGVLVALAVLLFFLTSWVVFFFFFRRDLKAIVSFQKGIREVSSFFCLLVISSLVLVFSSSLAADRYFALLCWANAVIAGWFLTRIFAFHKSVAVVLVVFLGAYFLLAMGKYISQFPRGNIYQLIDFLEKEDLKGGYAGYDQAYRLSFYSGQRLKFMPLEGMMRTPHYKSFIDSLDRKAVLLTSDDATHDAIRGLALAKKTKKIKRFGPYQIYVVDRSLPVPLR
jgi:hypothetical protein